MLKKIALISSLPQEYSLPKFYLTLQEIALQKYQIQIDIFKNGEFLCQFHDQGCHYSYHGQPFDARCYALAFDRFAIKAPHGGDHYILREFEHHQVPLINPTQALLKTKDKLQTLQLLARLNLPITPTFVVRTRDQIAAVLKQIGPGPYIVKNIFGSGGQVVLQANTVGQVHAIFDYVWNLDRNQILLIQPYVGTHPASDVRALYFQGKLWRAMCRHATQDDFRANVHIGATTVMTELTSEEDRICSQAVAATGLILAGIDFLRTPTGPQILEVNGCPGFSGIGAAYALHGIDLFAELTDLLCNSALR